MRAVWRFTTASRRLSSPSSMRASCPGNQWEARQIASKATGIPASHILISATHTHSAAAMTPAFQSDPDPEYVKTVGPRIAKGIIQAVANLEAAEFGWAFGSAPDHVFNRRWFVEPGRSYENPFGITTDRAQMDPGQVNPQVSVPSGPVDQDVAVIAVRGAADHRPIGLLANYSLHYVGGNPAISADYFGAFASEMAARLKAGDARYTAKPAFVGILSNGTSGNINGVNYGSPCVRSSIRESKSKSWPAASPMPPWRLTT